VSRNADPSDGTPPARAEVHVLGEPLLELSSDEPLETAEALSLSFSGDALNAAAASSSAGVRSVLLSRVGADEIGTRLLRYAEGLGVDTGSVLRGPEPTGAYLVGADPAGSRDFVYLRSGSAAAAMRPSDLDRLDLERADVLLVGGIAMASSPSLADTVVEAARRVSGAGGQVVYDPNFRRRLTTPAAARLHLERLVPWLSVVVPSAPSDTEALVDTADPQEAITRLRALGCTDIVVTAGAAGAHLALEQAETVHVPALPATVVRDATGAGDVFVGTLAAGLARGPLDVHLVRTASAAAALSLAGRGGTGHLAGREDVEALARSGR
jgi:2-dehydro-3-deoxygluconokinase